MRLEIFTMARPMQTITPSPLDKHQVGRVHLPAALAPAPHQPPGLGRFAHTGHALRIMERCAAALARREPVLLVGETGTGKTTTLSHLAQLVGFFSMGGGVFSSGGGVIVPAALADSICLVKASMLLCLLLCHSPTCTPIEPTSIPTDRLEARRLQPQPADRQLRPAGRLQARRRAGEPAAAAGAVPGARAAHLGKVSLLLFAV
jgi:hypothetical protein